MTTKIKTTVNNVISFVLQITHCIICLPIAGVYLATAFCVKVLKTIMLIADRTIRASVEIVDEVEKKWIIK